MNQKNIKYDIKHLLIIPDGFRRHAKSLNIEYSVSYKKGAKLGLEVLDYFNDASIFEMSYFLVSHRTLKREQNSVSSIFMALNYFLENVIDALKKNKYGFNIKFLGDLKKIPNDTLLLIDEIKKFNNKSFDRSVNLLIAYSGTENLYNNYSILKIVKDKSHAIGESDEYNNLLKKSLDTLSKIEVIIRSGDFFRLSDAPILETINSIFILIDKYLPELTTADIAFEIDKYINWKKNR